MKKTILFLMCAFLMLIMGACKSEADNPVPPDTADSGITVAVVPKALDNPIFLETKEAGETKAKELDITFEWAGPATSDAAGQIAVIESLIEKGVDGILISCNDAEALKDVINKAADAGIAVATFDSDSPDSKRSFYIGSDNNAIGKKCAEYIDELIPGGGKIAVLTGVSGAPNLEARIAGLRENVSAGIEILSILPCDDDIQKSVGIINEFSAENPDLAGWVFVGGWPFNADAEELAGLKTFTENGGVCVSVDTVYPMLQYVKLGMAQVLIGQDYSKMGSNGVQYLYDMIKAGEKPSVDFIDTGYVIVDKDNVEEALANKAPW